jgi:hypothetical protein
VSEVLAVFALQRRFWTVVRYSQAADIGERTNFRNVRVSRHRQNELWCHGTVLLGVLIPSLGLELHDSMHIDAEGLQLLLNLGFGHAFAYIFQQQVHESILRSVKLTLSVSSRDRREPIVALETVGSLGHQHQDLSFHLVHEVSCEICANPFQESARFSQPASKQWVQAQCRNSRLWA